MLQTDEQALSYCCNVGSLWDAHGAGDYVAKSMTHIALAEKIDKGHIVGTQLDLQAETASSCMRKEFGQFVPQALNLLERFAAPQQKRLEGELD